MPRSNRIWIIDDDRSIRWVLEKALQKAEKALAAIQSEALLSHPLLDFDKLLVIRRRGNLGLPQNWQGNCVMKGSYDNEIAVLSPVRPEGELTLAQAVVYLACAPKSNAVYTAAKAARKDAQDLGSLEVPMHLRNAPTKLMKELGYGENYRYAHDEEGAIAAGEKYFPDDMSPVKYYHPVPRGLEIRIKEKLEDIERRARKNTSRNDP